MAKKNWIAGAVKNKGGLHRALGIPAGKKIPKSKLTVHEGDTPRMVKMKVLANTLKKIRMK